MINVRYAIYHLFLWRAIYCVQFTSAVVCILNVMIHAGRHHGAISGIKHFLSTPYSDFDLALDKMNKLSNAGMSLLGNILIGRQRH